jgi:hypothetical protein
MWQKAALMVNVELKIRLCAGCAAIGLRGELGITGFSGCRFGDRRCGSAGAATADFLETRAGFPARTLAAGCADDG